jgi:hypothetical protein
VFQEDDQDLPAMDLGHRLPALRMSLRQLPLDHDNRLRIGDDKVLLSDIL